MYINFTFCASDLYQPIIYCIQYRDVDPLPHNDVSDNADIAVDHAPLVLKGHGGQIREYALRTEADIGGNPDHAADRGRLLIGL